MLSIRRKNRKRIYALFGATFFVFAFSLTYPFIRFSLSDSLSTNQHHIQIVGHRGAAGLAPENTLASFQKAIDLGVDIIELDIHLSADNELIVMHDSNLERTTNGVGEIENKTLQQIKQLDAGSWYHSDFKNEKVPTLNEVIDLVNGQCKLLVEIKWPNKGVYSKIVSKLIAVLQEKNYLSHVIIQSFETQYLEGIIQLNLNIPCHQLLFAKSDILPIYYDRSLQFGYFKPLDKISSLNIFYYYLNQDFINDYKKQNINIGSYTLNDPENIKKTASWGLQYLITDYPDIAIKTLNQYEIKVQ